MSSFTVSDFEKTENRCAPTCANISPIGLAALRTFGGKSARTSQPPPSHPTLTPVHHLSARSDKDFRYMATSDLLAELSKDTFKPDSDGERRMCKCLLKLINDQSSDVQSLAVKCLSPLVRKVHEERVDEIMTALVR